MDSQTFRKLVHMAGGLGAFALPYVPRWFAITTILGAAMFATLLLKFSSAYLSKFGLIASLMRPGESPLRNGMLTYTFGIGLAVMIFDGQPAAVGWLILAFGDGAATLIGSRWPIYRFPNKKSLGGSIGFFFAALFALCTATLIWPNILKYQPLLHVAAIVCVSLAGAVVEGITVEKWDNILIPIITGGLYIMLNDVGAF